LTMGKPSRFTFAIHTGTGLKSRATNISTSKAGCPRR